MSNVRLLFNNTEFPLYKDSYSLTFQNKESKNETEAGTVIRDIKRMGVPHLSISQTVNNTWYQKLFQYSISGAALTVSYYDPNTLTEKTFSGFIENLSYNLAIDRSKTYWKVSFEVTAY